MWLLVWLLGMTVLGWSYFQQDTRIQDTVGVWLNSQIVDLKNSLQWINKVVDPSQEKYMVIDKILDEWYYEKQNIDKDKMFENAVKWYVDAIGDPYTVYLTKDENEIFDEEMQGAQNFEWIWAVVNKKEDGVLIEEVLKDLPASRAGLKHLDLILEIDGEPTKSMTLTEAVKNIRGPKGSEVVLTIYRESENFIDEITVIRDAVNVPSVRGELLDIDGASVLYIEIAVIGEDTIMALRNIISSFKWQHTWVILDLRWNGGWYLPLAVDAVSFFLPRNELVTTARYTILDDEIYRSKWYGDLQDMPVVVLLDGLSASASEIIAGALKQRGDAVLVGTKSFGKWSIQTIADVDDGSSLKFTIGKWYLPDDANVDGVGITPDVEIEFDPEAYEADETDTQLEVAKQEIASLLNN